ncbi:fatty acid desaturase family protein [Micromonospora sp. NPDC047557]|uniref:fatty acid desaturase family protein n=1 Tax=Micromonospora sp. NPDC047557 TaxID=3364250 RepID=UPI003711B726
MQIWKKSPLDGILVALSVGQFTAMVAMAALFGQMAPWVKVVTGLTLPVMMAYNIIVITHLVTHSPWFADRRLNSAVSILNSLNIGQSVMAYQLTHVRNHHRFNNDPLQADGTTRDITSTYRGGRDGNHAPMLRYSVGGAAESLIGRAREFLSATRLWRVGSGEQVLLSLVSPRDPRRGRELGQIQLDRAAHSLSLIVFAAISWQWTLACYLPAFFLALTMVNVQNYYRHYGANPDDRAADSVSHYGRLYNLLSFNDGYHQEHHLNPTAHWSQLPAVRERARVRLDSTERIISPVPAMLGFLHTRRALLHTTTRESA